MSHQTFSRPQVLLRRYDTAESTPGATLMGIAVDLGISRSALKEWVDKLGSGTAVNAVAPAAGRSELQAARIVRLEFENAALTAEARNLQTERDILRQAAKYFGAETNW
jgi:transposase